MGRRRGHGPLTGFGHTLAKGVREAVASDGWIGIFTGGLTAAAGRHGRRGGGRAHGGHLPAGGQAVKGTGAAAAFVPADASNSGFSRLLRTAETTSCPICARPVRLLWRAGFCAPGLQLPKKSGCSHFLRSQGNRCRPVLILSFFFVVLSCPVSCYTMVTDKKSTEREHPIMRRFTALLLAALMLLSWLPAGRRPPLAAPLKMPPETRLRKRRPRSCRSRNPMRFQTPRSCRRAAFGTVSPTRPMTASWSTCSSTQWWPIRAGL